MSVQRFRVLADTLEEARAKAKSRIPDGQTSLHETVVSEGGSEILRTTAETVEKALEEAKTQIPRKAKIASERVVFAPRQQTITVQAFHERGAGSSAKAQIGDEPATIGAIRIRSVGPKGFLGFFPKPNLYEVDVLSHAVVEITYSTKADIWVVTGDAPGYVSVVVFSLWSREAPANAESYCRQMLEGEFPGTLLLSQYVIGYLDDLTPKEASYQYRRFVLDGRLPDLGEQIGSFKRIGPDGKYAVALFFSPKRELSRPSEPQMSGVQPDARPSPADADAYRASCMDLKYSEEPESRTHQSDPAFRKVLDPLNAGDSARACSEAQALATEFGDFAYLYYWWGKALLEMQSFDNARNILKGALAQTKRKYPLCNLLGETEWKARNIEEAVYWWAQGMHCQESLSDQNFGGDVGAYLHLLYVAEGLGLSDCASAFATRVDQIRPGRIRLNAETASDLLSLARNAANTQVPEVLQRLVATYVVPKTKETTRSDSEEVDRLIRQLEERDSLGWSGEKNVEAANRLGELGDPRAIEPLARAARALTLELQVAAEKAIKRIREANR